jgi:membrane-bound metal-dependent hydrolase YbcI (DUF457 family)
MDTITHGIAGALIGKAFFFRRNARVATFAATVGAMFPDIDIIRYGFSSDPLAIVKYHRAITHSFVALPLFALLLAWLTCAGVGLLKPRFEKLRDLDSPSWPKLWLIYAIAIASHIILDGMTSFGTRMWVPFSQRRVAWDILFIIDFVFTALVLLPQIVAWIYSQKSKSRPRAALMSIVFTVVAVAAWYVAGDFGFPFHFWIAVSASALIAALFFLPSIKAAGFRVSTPEWCQAGFVLTVIYLFFCTLAHHVAFQRVYCFAATKRIPIERIAALPLPPSLLDWGGEILSTNGVYQSRFDLRNPSNPQFTFAPDSPPDAFIARAMVLPEVRLYWDFARFPVIRSSSDSGLHFVDFNENRFIARPHPDHGPTPFSYRVVFNDTGDVVEEGWQADGINVRRMMKILPQHGKDLR